MNAQETGWLGETRALVYLRRRGLRVLCRRFRAAHGEIDLIARDGDTLVFIEVKTRIKGRLDEGLKAVNAEKRTRIRSAARAYLTSHPFTGPIRYDIVEISAAGLRHIKNAF